MFLTHQDVLNVGYRIIILKLEILPTSTKRWGGVAVVNNSLFKVLRSLKQVVMYQPPREPKPFVLDETEHDGKPAKPPSPKDDLTDNINELDALLTHARKLEDLLEKARQSIGQKLDSKTLGELQAEIKMLEEQQEELSPVLLAYTSGLSAANRSVNRSLDENKKLIQRLYHSDINKDIVIRDFEIPGEPSIRASLAFLDGMVDKQIIDLAVLQPLMILTASQPKPLDDELLTLIIEKYLPSNQASRVSSYKDVMDAVSSGDTALFIDGIAEAVVLATKGYKARGVERAQIEQSIRGSQAAFSEGLRTNTGLIRTFIPSNDLVTEIILVGDRVPQKCAIMYFESLANKELVAEVKRRVKGISTDYILNSCILEQFIEDHPSILFPQSISTERPDRTAAYLLEGQVALLYEGVPFANIVPASFFSFFHSIEDFSLKNPAGKFMRLLRLAGALLSVLLPASYLAISYFHQEALPTEMVLAIAGAREKVPFPAIFELIIMELSFELIREAGLRIPGVLGSTIGIVGAIILGQAAVMANLVSPIMVVIVAITGLASFTIPDYRMAFSFRLIRFLFLGLGAIFGLVGIAFGIVSVTTLLCSMKSFGVPYMAPIAPKTMAGYDLVMRGPVFRQEKRPDYLNPQDVQRQPSISRKWTLKRATGKGDDDVS